MRVISGSTFESLSLSLPSESFEKIPVLDFGTVVSRKESRPRIAEVGGGGSTGGVRLKK